MASIEQEIQRRIVKGELGSVREQWADGIVSHGTIVECPHSEPATEHFALVPETAFDDQVVCPEGHDIYLTQREGGLQITAEEPEDFSPPVILSEREIEFTLWVPRASMDERSDE